MRYVRGKGFWKARTHSWGYEGCGIAPSWGHAHKRLQKAINSHLWQLCSRLCASKKQGLKQSCGLPRWMLKACHEICSPSAVWIIFPPSFLPFHPSSFPPPFSFLFSGLRKPGMTPFSWLNRDRQLPYTAKNTGFTKISSEKLPDSYKQQ